MRNFSLVLLLLFSNYVNADISSVFPQNQKLDIALKILNNNEFVKAKLLFSELAKAKDPRGSFIYAWMLMAEDKSKAISYLKYSHKRGCNGAAGVLAWLDMNKNTKTRKDKLAYKPTLLEPAALKGDINSQFLYAVHLMNTKSYVDSFAWFSVINDLDEKAHASLIGVSKKAQKHLATLVSQSKLIVAMNEGKKLAAKYIKRDLGVCQQTRYLNNKGIDIITKYLVDIKK